MSRRAGSLAALLLYTGLAVGFTWPLAAHLSTLCGAEGDGPMFLWDLWWLRHALLTLHANPFHCEWLFAPLGADLYLHTLTPFRGLQAMLLEPVAGLVAAHNLLYLSSLALAGFGMSRLAAYLGRSPAAAFLAGGVFSFSTYHLARGHGHFNLTEIQWLPFCFLYLVRGIEERRRRLLVAAAVFLLMTAYSDYYYLTYAVLLIALYLGHRWVLPELLRWRAAGPPTTAERRLGRAIRALLGVIAAVLAIGGIDLRDHGVQFTVRRLDRLLLVLATLLVAWLVLRGRRSGLAPIGRGEWRARRGAVLVVGGVFLAGFSPVLAGLAMSGKGGMSQLAYSAVFSRFYGANLQGFLIPGTRAPESGHWLARWWPPSPHWLASGIEGRNFLGLVPLLLAALAVLRCRDQRWVRFLAAAGLLFFLLALGPTLHAGATELMVRPPRSQLLPYHWLARIPLLGAVRVPARFSVMVSFCLAPLAAFGLDRLRQAVAAATGRARLAAAVVLLAPVLALAEQYPGRFHGRPMAVPAPYARIAADPAPGAILDLPLTWSSGVDGFGSDEMIGFYYQTVHRKRIFSGHASRLPPDLFDRLFREPLAGAVMSIETGCKADPWLAPEEVERAREAADRIGVRYAVFHWDWPDPEGTLAAVAGYLDQALDWEPIAGDEGMSVWRRR